MGAVMDVQEVDIGGWRGVSLTAERSTLVVAPEAGGRLVSLKFDGIETLFSLEELRGRRIDLSRVVDVRAKKRELGWLHYGGYKTWLAPQDRWTDGLPFLDLDSGSYDVAVQEGPAGPVVRLTSPVCRETGMQLTRAVSISGDRRLVIEQAMTNRSTEEAAWGLWDITQVRGPGLAILPVADDSRFEGGVKAYTTEGRSPEVISQYVEVTGRLATVTCPELEPFKYGTDSMEGWILGLLDRGTDQWLAFLKIFEPAPGAMYPHQSTVEVYDSGNYPYFELEVHSPLKTLAADETYGYRETWVLDWLPKSASTQEIGEWIREELLG